MGSASRLPRRSSTLSRPAVRRCGRLQHGRRLVDADHRAHVGRQRGGDLAGAAAEVGDHPVAAAAAQQRRLREARRRTARRAAGPTCPPRRRRTPRPGWRSAQPGALRRSWSCWTVAQPSVCSRASSQSRRGAGLASSSGHAVEVGRCPAARLADPALVGQDLQVAADRGLRQLQDVAQLGHAQLVPLQQAQQPQAGGVGEALHPGQERRPGRGRSRGRARLPSLNPDERIESGRPPVNPLFQRHRSSVSFCGSVAPFVRSPARPTAGRSCAARRPCPSAPR